MAIDNSIRDVLPGYGTAGLRGGQSSGASPRTVNSPMYISMGKLRIKIPAGAGATTVTVTGTDGATTVMIYGVTLPAYALGIELSAEFVSDVRMTSFTCTAAGNIDFEVYGQPESA